jgi:hypothetical protein
MKKIIGLTFSILFLAACGSKKGAWTEEEKQKAINALKEGFDKKFVWGVDSSGAHRPYRIL